MTLQSEMRGREECKQQARGYTTLITSGPSSSVILHVLRSHAPIVSINRLIVVPTILPLRR